MRRVISTMYRLRFAILALIVSLVMGCPNHKKAKSQSLGPPAMDLRKAVSFPLATAGLPGSREELTAALVDGLRKHVKLAENEEQKTIVAQGDHYPALRRLDIDLTNAAIDTSHKPAKLQRGETPAPGVRAEQFQFRADPLNIDGGHIHLIVHARDVSLGVIHDRAGQPILSLDEARDGEVSCQTTTKDLSTIFRASANERGKPFGLSVQKAQLDLDSQSDREMTANLRLISRLLIIPIQLHFTAHVAVDDAGNATLSRLSCEGDDAAGTLITQFIRPALADYNNRTMPLVGFPSKKMRLHDVRVRLNGETVRLAAAFGS
jgi:hypothetical protein